MLRQLRLFFYIVAIISVSIYTLNAVAAPPPVPTFSEPLTAIPAAAAIVPSIDAGRLSKQLQRSAIPAPKLTTKTETNAPPEQAVSKAAEIKFKLTKVSIDGNTVYSEKELQKIFAPSINHNISLIDLQHLVHLVTIKYRTDGYILSRAILPPQVIKAGMVRVQVIEGFVSSVLVKGDVGRAEPLLRGYGKHVMESRPLQIHELERYALIANDLPGYSVKAVLTPSKTIPAGADLTLFATRRHMSAYIAYDNYGTRYIGPLETSFGFSLYSVLTAGDVNNIRFSVTSRPHELQFVEFSHAQPIGTSGLRMNVGINYAETNPGFILSPVNIIGRNNTVFGDLSYPLFRERNSNVIIHAGANYENVTSTILGIPFYVDRIRNVVLGMSMDNIDKWRGINTLTADMTHGLNVLGADDHFEQSRPEGHSQYTRLNLIVSRLQSLTPRFSLYGVLHAQYAMNTLLATEQFGIGGSDVGRGYDPSEIVGDHGISGKLELRMDTVPGKKLLNTVQYYIFYDAGSVWNIDTTDFPARLSATSAGVGARFTFIPQVTGNLYIAKPIDRPVSVLTLMGENSTAARVFFQLVASV